MEKEYSLAEGLKLGLEQAIAFKQGDESKAKSKTIQLKPLPKYKGADIKRIRSEFGLTQKKFAKLLGVSLKTVEAWEGDSNPPSGAASRLLSLLDEDKELLHKFFEIKE